VNVPLAAVSVIDLDIVFIALFYKINKGLIALPSHD
jgi:hypothetical protein